MHTKQYKYKWAIGVFLNSENIQLALEELKNANVSIKNQSIIAKYNLEEEKVKNLNQAAANVADDGLTELFDLGLLKIPRFGSIILAGAEALAISYELIQGKIGAAHQNFTNGLIDLGIPKDKAKIYTDLVEKGYYLLILKIDNHEIGIVQMILHKHNIENWGVYDMSAFSSTSSI
ncbi:hypothetical protein NIES267_39860 [Calothrix parasitica NIES-267]|uniref:Uncharacterized protein n=1 Tax=Calothrix parasitica NIES-267 TaxID=1973488 RepID=A0A1Z4LTC8_9CYAN|nr:hypothetical protein NIES267_39860 [Calothrix parasitica NIES-267]